MAKSKRIKFTVATTGAGFPFDMLRYDAAWPSSERDAHEITRIHRDHITEPGQPVAVVLESDNPFAPNVERWNSFSCVVVAGDNRELAKRAITSGLGQKGVPYP